MTSQVGFITVFLWLCLRINFTQSSIDIKDVLPLKCRTAGVVLVDKKFNYTTSEAVCDALGLRLASRADVQKAWRFGFETCSYGWVTERYGVISRIHNNEKCGKNQTGVLTWTVPLTHLFSAYCFNASDLRINSCKPELMVTISPSTAAPTAVTPLRTTTHSPRIPEPQERTTTSPISPTTLRAPTIPSLLTTLMVAPKTTAKEVPPPTAPRVTTRPPTTPPPTTPPPTTPPPTEEPTNPPENQAARQSEKIVFGKLPTALLILALVFFLAAIVLAICYIKKYKTNVFFRKIKEEKESVETKVFKETAITDYTKEEEASSNGREEKPQNSEANAGSGLEAEV